MLTIRFSRIGKKRKPFYRIIISEKQRDTQGKYLELLGHFNPHTKEAVLKSDRIQHWVGLGATMSNSVYNLMVNHKVIQADTKRRSVFISQRRAAAIAEEQKQENQKKAAAEAVPEQKTEEPTAPAA